MSEMIEMIIEDAQSKMEGAVQHTPRARHLLGARGSPTGHNAT